MAQAATSRTLQAVTSFEGMVMARVCTPEDGCVMAQVMAHLQVHADGTGLATYWDIHNHENSKTVVLSDPCQGAALARLFAAVASVALAPTAP